ncbi:MAG: hypothetical protein KF847_02095 [Pirellulales bacterium]|nr:hypothetical protein [Pirellulales bacterium]
MPVVRRVVVVGGLLVLVAQGLVCSQLASAEAPAAKAESAPSGAGLYPSAILYHKLHHDDVPVQLRRVAELGFRRVQLVVTLHVEIDEQFQVQRYFVQSERRHVPLDEKSLAEFRTTLRKAFAEAARLGLGVSVAAHLNSTGKIDEWRNHFRFDPLAEYEGFTYREALIEPIVEAAAAEMPADAVVDLSLCGEMGRSVFEHPEAYRQMIGKIRDRAGGLRRRLGVSLNFDNQASEANPSAEQIAALNALLAESDLLGMSQYRWFMLPPDAGDFAGAVEQFYAGLDKLGVKGHRTLPLVFTEVGLGGGAGGNRPATLPLAAALRPWEGVANSWQSPWLEPGMRKFRVDYHRALLEFLAAPPREVPIVEAFLWSELSWDPLDVIDRGFADEDIAKMIGEHNERIETGAHERAADAPASQVPLAKPH